jgi:hypothetical protein
MGDFEKHGQPTPVIEDVAERVEHLECQGVFVGKSKEAKTLPISLPGTA